MLEDYVLIMRDTKFCLVGPFTNIYDAISWGNENANGQKHGEDDPRWQTIKLRWDQANNAPPLFAPERAMDHLKDLT